jgi:CheY-like chemotaxis protein/HPt (histidine-containing phosphotransfer) domain-containing protein
MYTNTGKPVSRVLVADDDPVIRRWLTSILEGEGYEVVSVRDGREVFRLLQSDANFQGAVLDLSMPHIEGPDLIRYMRTEKRLMRIPVMMITAESHIGVLANGMAAGATVLLPKPFTKTRLQNTLGMMLGKKPEVEKGSLPTTTRTMPLAKDWGQGESPKTLPATVINYPNGTVAAEQPVDLQVLMSLEPGDDEEAVGLIAELIDLYLDNAEHEVNAIKSAVLEMDEGSLKKRIHSLKGSSSTIGACRIANLCGEFEETSEGRTRDSTEELVKKLENAFASTRTVLLAERRERLQRVAA